MEVIPKQTRHFMPFLIKVKASGLPPHDLDTQMFHPFIVVLLFN